MALPGLGGLFAATQCPDLDSSRLSNRALLEAVFRLTWLTDDNAMVRVNWRDMGTEELGSVYESLLELVPELHDGARRFGFVGDPAPGFEGQATATQGNARKLTGSYYTPDSLVQALLESTLDAVIERALAADVPEQALLSLSILVPAMGSGHFLLGAARGRQRISRGYAATAHRAPMHFAQPCARSSRVVCTAWTRTRWRWSWRVLPCGSKPWSQASRWRSSTIIWCTAMRSSEPRPRRAVGRHP